MTYHYQSPEIDFTVAKSDWLGFLGWLKEPKGEYHSFLQHTKTYYLEYWREQETFRFVNPWVENDVYLVDLVTLKSNFVSSWCDCPELTSQAKRVFGADLVANVYVEKADFDPEDSLTVSSDECSPSSLFVEFVNGKIVEYFYVSHFHEGNYAGLRSYGE